VRWGVAWGGRSGASAHVAVVRADTQIVHERICGLLHRHETVEALGVDQLHEDRARYLVHPTALAGDIEQRVEQVAAFLAPFYFPDVWLLLLVVVGKQILRQLG